MSYLYSYSEDEISDSEDEVQPAKKNDPPKANVPQWAETPFLKKALQEQTIRDPDNIFGAGKPLVLEGNFSILLTMND